MSCIHVNLAAFVKIDRRHPHGRNCPTSGPETVRLQRNPLIIRGKKSSGILRTAVGQFPENCAEVAQSVVPGRGLTGVRES
jgi:hypothetical protein